MGRSIVGLSFLLLCSCASMVEPGVWPQAVGARIEIDKVVRDRRIVVIEQEPASSVRRFLAHTSDQQNGWFDRYIFWDLCREGQDIWQMVTFKPDGNKPFRWLYTKTLITDKQSEPSTKTTEGKLRRPVASFTELREIGLSFFKPGEIQCDDPTGTIIRIEEENGAAE